MIVCSRIQGNENEKKSIRQHKTAYDLLHRTLEHFYHLTSEECEVEKKDNGKPYLCKHLDIHISISHCENMVAVSAGAFEQGVDIERVRPYKVSILKRGLCEKEMDYFMKQGKNPYDFFRFWTLKESFVKTTGEGIRRPLTEIEFQFDEQKVLSNQDNFNFYNCCILNDFVLAYCEDGPMTDAPVLYQYENHSFIKL